MKKVCLIGCGDHAYHVYLDAILRCRAEMPEILLGACCDTDLERARDFAGRVGAGRVYADYREMLAEERPDAAILLTPYHLTASIAAEVMDAGCAVLLEKPPAADYPSCLALCETARQTGRINQAAFNRRHIPVVREMRRHLNGAQIHHIDYHMYRINRTESYFYATAVHGVDLICSLMASPCVQANFQYGALPEAGEGVENLLMQLSFQNGGTAQLSFCPVSGFLSEGMTVIASNGSYQVDFPIWSDTDTGRLLFSDNTGRASRLEASDGPRLFESNGFYWQLRQFYEAVLQGKPSPDSIETALETMRLTDCLREKRTRIPER